MTPCDICRSITPLDPPETSETRPEAPNDVLIVEDDSLIAQDLRERLEGLGHRVFAVADCAEQAVRLVEQKIPDLVLMDIQLEGDMDGIQAAEKMRLQKIPVVYVTGCCSDMVLRRAMQAEPYGYLLKPYETEDLKVAIEVALHKSRREIDQRRLVTRLQQALANVKTMAGLLSICAYCKKIKGQAGEWPEVERYVMEHSHATFSHGMCPACFERVKAQLQSLEGSEAGPESFILG